MQHSATGAEAVILDPYRPYALMMIEHLHRRHGVRTICLHSDWKTRILLEGRHPVLRSPAVSAHYMVGPSDWQRIAARLRTHHHVVGVLPYEEGMVAPLAHLAEMLNLSWAQPAVLPAFRDKAALKTLIARNDPAVRLNVFAAVRDAVDVAEVLATHRLDRYVLKPNDGSGNNDVAFFDKASGPEEVATYFDNVRGPVLMEEFVNGPEYWVNGQVDEAGEPMIQGIGTYLRVNQNGVRNLEIASMSVAPSEPVFSQLHDYAEAVMRATGLRRSPFHLEAIVDERGPCLVEVGARFCGELGVLVDQYQHCDRRDFVDMACHYYVSQNHYPAPPLDWARYSSRCLATVTGTSPHAQRLVQVDGVREVESSPHFVFWVKRPQAGDHVDRTTSLTTRAWSVVVQAANETELLEVVGWARSTIVLRGTANGPWPLRTRMPMYRGLASKVWSSRPRLYQARALVGR